MPPPQQTTRQARLRTAAAVCVVAALAGTPSWTVEPHASPSAVVLVQEGVQPPWDCRAAVIRAPFAGDRLSGSVPVFGSAQIPDFQFYKVEWARADDPETWIAVSTTIEQPVRNGLLDTWDPPEPAEGRVRLKLTVVDSTYQERCRFTVEDLEVVLGDTAGETTPLPSGSAGGGGEARIAETPFPTADPRPVGPPPQAEAMTPPGDEAAAPGAADGADAAGGPGADPASEAADIAGRDVDDSPADDASGDVAEDGDDAAGDGLGDGGEGDEVDGEAGFGGGGDGDPSASTAGSTAPLPGLIGAFASGFGLALALLLAVALGSLLWRRRGARSPEGPTWTG